MLASCVTSAFHPDTAPCWSQGAEQKSLQGCIGKISESHQPRWLGPKISVRAGATTSARLSYLPPTMEAAAFTADGATQVKQAALLMSTVPSYCG